MSICNAMTVDVEDYFQVSAFEQQVDRADWERLPCRVEANVERILELFESSGIRATFFTLGWVAERYPGLVRRIVAEGHELASHGWEHRRATTQSKTEFLEDVTRTRALLEDTAGVPVRGYRAASYSIGADNLWALDLLAEAGYKYSSSIVPVKHDLYGMPGAPRFAFPAAGGQLLEVPITTISVAGRTLNAGGGGWFRLYPYAFSRWALQQVNQVDHQPGIFYFHPWEIDPEQPRPAGASLKTRFRHYLNLSRMYGRLQRLLKDFEWGRMDDIFLDGRGAGRDPALS
jgi:polysaccharide deacetylase family protein (PEP-CTERM system associated)